MLPDIANEQAKANDVALIIINDWVEPSILAKVNQERVRVVLLNRHEGSKNPWSIIKLNLFLMKFRPDVIHTHAYREINLVVYPFGKRVRTIHNTYNVSDEYPKYDKLISISKAVYEFTQKQGFDSVVADNGIPVSRIAHTKVAPFADGKLHFIQVSRLDLEQKGQDILLKALGILKNIYGFTNFKMHFVGNGGGKSQLIKMTHELHLDNHVIFEGLKEQAWIYENLCRYDLFIQPSRYEGFGLTVAEAIAAKIPVLVSNIEGPLEIIDGGRLGMTFENKNVEDCANKILEFVKQGRNETIVEQAFQYVCEHYDVSVTAQKYLNVYRSLISAKNENSTHPVVDGYRRNGKYGGGHSQCSG